MPSRAPTRDLGISPAALDQLFADLDRYLAQHAPRTDTGLVSASVDELIAQAGIQTGPAPLPRRGWLLRRAAAPSITVAQHIDLIAEVIQRYGWAQNTTWDGQRRCCIVGAQHLLIHYGYGDRDLGRRAGDWLNRQLGGGVNYVQWQNNRWRTKQQVLDMLRTAAANARTAGV
ncbi:DUF6197 family protein [Streptomyces hoynatensis]|uniref:Uncharacterized protein n=1 Tax=Streptomyces hoynatensis TaxID=1141874 RepID=A0A3A9YXE4_9ACTN|nr:hypothetical protein [Streptomyces hoynatensis]RKN40792.1 hypothetical protein D7294_17030 [Streptomyces hoynatensis]